LFDNRDLEKERKESETFFIENNELNLNSKLNPHNKNNKLNINNKYNNNRDKKGNNMGGGVGFGIGNQIGNISAGSTSTFSITSSLSSTNSNNNNTNIQAQFGSVLSNQTISAHQSTINNLSNPPQSPSSLQRRDSFEMRTNIAILSLHIVHIAYMVYIAFIVHIVHIVYMVYIVYAAVEVVVVDEVVYVVYILHVGRLFDAIIRAFFRHCHHDLHINKWLRIDIDFSVFQRMFAKVLFFIIIAIFPHAVDREVRIAMVMLL
jgi:hypothetical protein